MTRHGHYVLGGENPPKSTYYEQGKFGRMFPMLRPFASDTPLRCDIIALETTSAVASEMTYQCETSRDRAPA